MKAAADGGTAQRVSRRTVLATGASVAATVLGAGAATGQEVTVPQPPRDTRIAGEPFPVPEPIIREKVPREWSGQIENVQPVERESIEDEPVLDDRRQQRAVDIALENERVQEFLAGDRSETIGAVLRAPESKADLREGRRIDVVIFNYDRNVTLEVGLGFEDLEVQAVRRALYQPPPTENELETATEIALEDERLPRKARQLQSTGILTCPDPEDRTRQGCFHRIIDVRFGRPDQALPEFFAIVDLSSLGVLEAGQVEEDGCPCPTVERQPAFHGATAGGAGRGDHG